MTGKRNKFNDSRFLVCQTLINSKKLVRNVTPFATTKSMKLLPFLKDLRLGIKKGTLSKSYLIRVNDRQTIETFRVITKIIFPPENTFRVSCVGTNEFCTAISLSFRSNN